MDSEYPHLEAYGVRFSNESFFILKAFKVSPQLLLNNNNVIFLQGSHTCKIEDSALREGVRVIRKQMIASGILIESPVNKVFSSNEFFLSFI